MPALEVSSAKARLLAGLASVACGSAPSPRPESAPAATVADAPVVQPGTAELPEAVVSAADPATPAAAQSADETALDPHSGDDLEHEQVEIVRVPFDETQIPLTAETSDDFAPSGWQVESTVALDWNGDELLDWAIQFVEVPYEAGPDEQNPDEPKDRLRGLLFAQGEATGFRRVGLGHFLPSTLSGGAMWGGTDVEIDLGVSDDGRNFEVSWVVGARSRSHYEMVFGWDEQKMRMRLVRRTVGWGDTLDGSHASVEEDFAKGTRVETEEEMNGTPRVKRSRMQPKFVPVEDAQPE